MSAEASRVEKVEVEFKFRGIATWAPAQGSQLVRAIVTEAEGKDLMHALADSLGYDAVKRV